MKPLNVDDLDDNGESEDGCLAIEAAVEELAQIEVGTCCGHQGNKCFVHLKATGYADRLCRGWYDGKTNEVVGMFHIECKSIEDAKTLSDRASEVGGSLRFSGSSLFAPQNVEYKFFEFEIE